MAANLTALRARRSRERKGRTSRVVPERTSRRRSLKALNLEMAERFRAWLAAQRYSLSTQERYHRIACKLCHFIGGKALSVVTPMDIGDFLTKTLPDRWEDSYISDHLGPLRSFFDFLYLGGVVDSVAPRFLKARARPKALPRALTQTQVTKLIRAAGHPRDRALVEFLYATGCRIGEVCELRVEDIDFKGRRCRVCAKRKDRVVYFGEPAAKALHGYLRGRKTGYLFQDKIRPQKGYITYYKKAWIGNWKDYRSVGKRGAKHSRWLGNPSVVSYAEALRQFRKFLKGVDLARYKPDRPMNRSTLSAVVREIGRRAGIRNVSPHTIRHSFATHLLEKGADIRAIQELLGHSYLTSTQVYIRISNNAVRSTFHRFHPRG
jgi:site-specific recombinase XerD